MWNPLKMNPIEKRMLIGGIASGLTYYANMYASLAVPYPAELNAKLDPHLPSNANLIGSVAPPAVFWVVKKVSKKTAMKEKLADMGFGSFLYSIPNLARDVIVNTAAQEGLAHRPAAIPLPMSVASKYIANNSMNRVPMQASSVSKYVLTS